jgi:alpha-glucoside transport system permease protein
MEFDFAAEQPKFLMLMYGLIAFVAVVGGLLLLLDAVPAWFARRREARLVAAVTSGAPLPRWRKPREGLFALFFLLPTLLFLLVGLVVPAIRTTLLSFMDNGSNNWVGVRNYGWMFSEPSIVRVLTNTLIWVLLVPLVAASFGLIYAVLVDRARFEAVAKSLIFLPMAISFVGASIIWKFVYAYRSSGCWSRR